MLKVREKSEALRLRREGSTYKDIMRRVRVAKSTLALWFRETGEAEREELRLRASRRAAQLGREKLRKLRVDRLHQIREEAQREAEERIARGDLLWLFGTALYWAEGSKAKAHCTDQQVEFTNTDPRMILLAREWLRQSCSVVGSDLKYRLYIHENADIAAARLFWSRLLNVSLEQIPVCLKRNIPSPRKRNIQADYCGTIRIVATCSSRLNHRINGWVGALVRYWGVV